MRVNDGNVTEMVFWLLRYNIEQWIGGLDVWSNGRLLQPLM